MIPYNCIEYPRIPKPDGNFDKTWKIKKCSCGDPIFFFRNMCEKCIVSIPAIKIGQIFTVEGNRYVVGKPKDELNKSADANGNIIMGLFPI